MKSARLNRLFNPQTGRCFDGANVCGTQLSRALFSRMIADPVEQAVRFDATDHPGVWTHIAKFLTQVVKRYRGSPALRGWDVWNELRWGVNSDGFVCFCPHTLTAFRRWLDARYGGLDGLNSAWKRRYGAWEEVMPGKLPNRPYTEMMAWSTSSPGCERRREPHQERAV